MDKEYPENGVYVHLATNRQLPDGKLRQSLLLVLKTLPNTQYEQLSGLLYWCPRDEMPQPIGVTQVFFTGQIRGDDGKIFRYGHAVAISDFEREVSEFAIFLGTRGLYRALMDLAGRKSTRRLLIRSHDLAALQAFAKNSRVLTAVRKSGLLSEILRGREQQFAFLALEKILNEDQVFYSLPTSIDSIRTTVDIDGSTRLEFIADYEQVLGEIQPINAVIGANGAGKTRLLLSLAKAARNGCLKVSGDGGRARAGASVHPSDLLSFTYEPGLWSQHRRAGVTVIGLGVGAREWRSLTSVLQELAQSGNSDFSIRAYAEVIAAVVDPNEILVPIAHSTPYLSGQLLKGKHYISLAELLRVPQSTIGFLDPTLEITAWSPRFGHYHLSSGQRSLLLLTAQLFLHGERSIVLIDEPENHLHPQYITLLMRSLQSALIAMESRAIVITHSPFVIRELDKGAVQILDRDADLVPCLYQTSLQTFGGDVGQISEHVFGDDQVKKGYQVLIQNALADASQGNVTAIAKSVSLSLGDDGELYLQQILDGQSNAN